MKTLILYHSRSGNTRKVAEAIAAALPDADLKSTADAPDLAGYDYAIFGFGIYRGWPTGEIRTLMTRWRGKPAGIFFTLGANPDSEAARTCLGRVEGLLSSCRIFGRFICQGRYTEAMIERMKSRPAASPHGWNAERAARVAAAAAKPDESDLATARNLFVEAHRKATAYQAAERPESPTGLLLTVFGSSHETAGRAYRTLADAVRARRPTSLFRLAFLSDTVRRKLFARSQPMPSVAEALQQLHDEGVRHVEVVAGLLSDGEEYARLQRELAGFELPGAGFDSIKLTRPPLGDRQRLIRFVTAAWNAIPSERTPDDAVLFMGHGNADGRSDGQYLELARQLAERDPRCHLACVEGCPAFEPIRQKLATDGTRRIFLAPFLLVAGDHAANDLAGPEPDSWKSQLEAAGLSCIVLGRGLGEQEAIARYFAGELPER